MTRGLRNNNPGNIRKDGTHWKGEVEPSQDRDFKQFETMAWGYRAMFQCLNTYYRKYGLRTVKEFITRYAPPGDNNHTGNYIAAVCCDAKILPDGRITTTNRDIMVAVVAAMSKVENGIKANMADVESGWELFIANR